VLESSFSILMAGFSLGLLHALDADHVMAVSTLSTRKPGLLNSFKHSAHWALGHAAMLVMIGLMLFGLGVHIPETFQHLAEASVGVLLMVMGIWCLWHFKKNPLQLKVHRHGDIVHSHLCLADDENSDHQKSAKHAPMFIGMLHGLAGSAPALALVPIVMQGQLSVALVYLTVFSLGVLISMVMFGAALGQLQVKLQNFNIKIYQVSRYLIASASVVLGGVWLSQSL
jgi:sulfite exporter TauE/SafE